MTSVFRRRIAHRVLSTIEDSLQKNIALGGPDAISPLLKMKRFGRNVPQLQLPVHKLQKINPELEEYFNKPTTLIKALRNQGLPNADGVTEISFDNNPPSSIVFTLDGDIFNKAVLADICVNLDVMTFRSCNFHNIIPKNILVEYSSPQLGKPLHMGYFRSTIHGNFIANINRFVGHKVTRINSVEDWGPSYGLLVAGYEEFGLEDQLERRPNFHLSEVLKAAYEKARADDQFREKAKLYYKKMVEGDMEILSALQKLRDPCVKEFKETYKLLGIEFDETHYDSMYTKEIVGIEQELIEKRLMDSLQNGSENSLSPSENEGTQKPIIDEFYSPTYRIARSIGAALYKKNRYNFDEMYYVANSSQKKHFSLLCSILEAMGHDWCRTMRLVKLEDFKSSRGREKKLLIDEVLQNAKITVLRDIRESIVPKTEGDVDDIAGLLSTASLFVNDMSHRKNRDYSFDLRMALQVDGNSGISLQLCHAALTELLNESEIKVKFDVDTTFLTEAEALILIRHLSRFDEIIFKAYYTLEPCIIHQYLGTLSNLVEKAIATLSLSLKDDRLKVIKARLLLFHAAQKVLQKGLELLGIKPLDRFK